MFTVDRLVTGAVSAVIVLVVREIVAYVKDQRASTKRLRTLTTVALDEVSFHLAKLKQLETGIAQNLETAKTKGDLFIPSFTLHPEFLEEQRRLIAEYGLSTSDITQELRHCGFELRHIVKRMADARPATLQSGALAVSDWKGVLALIKLNVPTFEDTKALLIARVGPKTKSEEGETALPAN